MILFKRRYTSFLTKKMIPNIIRISIASNNISLLPRVIVAPSSLSDLKASSARKIIEA